MATPGPGLLVGGPYHGTDMGEVPHRRIVFPILPDVLPVHVDASDEIVTEVVVEREHVYTYVHHDAKGRRIYQYEGIAERTFRP